MNKDRKKRVHRYTSNLKAPKIEPLAYYITDKNNKLKQVDCLEVKSEGITFGVTKNKLDKEIDKNYNLNSLLNNARDTLTSILIDYGYNTSNVELRPLIDDILRLNIIHPNKQYMGFKLDGVFIVSEGYDVIIEKRDIPDDIYNGYYEWTDNTFKINSERYHQYWGV